MTDAEKPLAITLLSATLRAGGAERAVVTLAAAFTGRGHRVSLVTWNRHEPDFYTVPDGVDRRDAGIASKEIFIPWSNLRGNARRLAAIRLALSNTRPDVVVSFQDGTNELFLVATIGARYARVVSCQNDITRKDHFNTRWEKIRRWTYPMADRVVFLDETQANRVSRIHGRWRCDGIPNPLPSIELRPGPKESRVIDWMSGYSHCIAAMGRLTRQKGFDLLLEAFFRILPSVPGCGLVILGDGPLRSDLVSQCERLGLTNSVLMPGTLNAPHAVISRCEVFAFSSRYEGQGLALAEAMACGVPPVSFDCPSGPGEMIADGTNGLLVPEGDVAGLAQGVLGLLGDGPRRRRLGEEARKIADRLDPDRIAARWESLFASTGRGAHAERDAVNG